MAEKQDIVAKGLDDTSTVLIICGHWINTGYFSLFAIIIHQPPKAKSSGDYGFDIIIILIVVSL